MNHKLMQNVYKIDKGDIDEVIAFAKNYNIFQTNGTQFYNIVVQKIKDRLDKEGLSYDVVKPN